MILNNYSYNHVAIRMLCHKIEQLTGLKLETNFSEEFNKVIFRNELSYLILDFRKKVIISLNVNIKLVYNYIDDVIITLSFLETGLKVQKEMRRYARKRKK